MLQSSAPALTTPHIITFMIDDLDRASLDRLVAAGLVPNIRKHLIERGTDFRQSYSTDSICCPSRATFFSGQYVHNHGVKTITVGSRHIYPSDATGQGGEGTFLPTWLQAAGYETALFGKYLNGYGSEVKNGETRIPQGYNYWLALQGANTYKVFGYDYNENGTMHAGGTDAASYQTDFIRDRAVAYINSINPKTPQFVYIAPTAPHTEVGEDRPGFATYGSTFSWTVRPAPRHERYMDGDESNGEVPAINDQLPNYNESDATYSSKPGWMKEGVPSMTITQRAGAARQYKQRMAAMLAIDEMVGAVVDALAARGMLDNTLLLFTADNGYFLGEHRLAEKGAPYEEGLRVPLVIRAPSSTTAANACPLLVGNHDLAATISDYANAKPTRKADGRSLRSLIEGKGTSSRRNLLIEHYQEATHIQALDVVWPYGAIRTQSTPENPQQSANEIYTLFERENVVNKTEYYDLNNDPYQLNNRGTQLSSTDAASLSRRLGALRTCAGSECKSAEDAPK